MMRAMLAVSAGLLCGVYGMHYAVNVKQDAQSLLRWTQLLENLSLIIREQALALPAALRQAADSSLEPDRLLHDVASALEAEPLLSLADAFRRCSRSASDNDVLYRLFIRLGRGSAESRLLALQQTRDALTLLAQRASQRAERDARLYRTLGWTGGVCLTILLL